MNQLNEPKSICTCGHTGDGPGSQHLSGILQAGHGRCAMLECQNTCPQFTWKKFLPGIVEEFKAINTPPKKGGE